MSESEYKSKLISNDKVKARHFHATKRNYFNEKAMELLNRMKAREAKSLNCRKALSKIIRRHEKAFANFGKNFDEILSEFRI